MICKICNNDIDPNASFCPHCGMTLNSDETNTNTYPVQPQNTTPFITSEEKILSVLSYFGILIIAPAVAGKTEYTKFHVGQGIRLLISCVAMPLAAGILSLLASVFTMIFYKADAGDVNLVLALINIILSILWYIALLAGAFTPTVLSIIGIINAATGKMKPLPLIGKIGLKK